MKYDALLITLPDVYMHGADRNTSSPPLGLGYVKAYLNEKDINSKILNLYSQKRTSLFDYDVGVEQVCEHDFEILGISASGHEYFALIDFCKQVKQRRPEAKIVVGGYASFDDDLLKEPSIDYAVVGEGEQTGPELFDAILQNNLDKIDEIKGVKYRTDEGVHFTGKRERIKDLDKLLYPDLSDTPPDNSYPMFSSRGCFNRGCNYCSSETMHPQYKTTSPEKMVDEIKYAQELYPDIHNINFNDDSFDIARLPDIIEELDKNGLRMGFSIQTTAENIKQNEDILDTFKDYIIDVGIGLESFNEEQLKEYNKRISPEENWKSVEICHDIGIAFDPYIIVDRTPERVEKTIHYLTDPKFWPYWNSVSPLMNHRFTRMYDISKQHYDECKNRFDVSQLGEDDDMKIMKQFFLRQMKENNEMIRNVIEQRYRPIWDRTGKPEYDEQEAEKALQCQKNYDERFLILPWQAAYTSLMRVWFEYVPRLAVVRQMHESFAEDSDNMAKEENMLTEFYSEMANKSSQAVEKLDTLPKRYIELALTIGSSVYNNVYEYYSKEFLDILYTEELLIRLEVDGLLNDI